MRDGGARIGQKKGDLLAVIWDAYPGFTYRELLNLDLRDRDYWYRAACRKLARLQLSRIEAASAVWMKGPDQKRLIRNLRREAYPPAIGSEAQEEREQRWAENRARLKRRLQEQGGRYGI